jgi:putative NIF3 family GTP cyclohydrolase 1 type 2
MRTGFISRRRFALVAGTVASAHTLAAQNAGAEKTLTATAAVGRIVAALGGDQIPGGADGFKAGDAAGKVHGIATTAMATMDVLRSAAKAGANLIITHEPTFFGRSDGPPAAGAAGGRGGRGGVAADDPVYVAKRDFIEKNGLIVYRLRDRWLAGKQDTMITGLAESLGWTRRVKPDDTLYDITPATYEQIVAQIRTKLKLVGGLRAVGDRKAIVRRVMLHPGVAATNAFWTRYTDADLIVAGEVREWENTHFFADLLTAGEKHGLVTVGRVVSEDPGMRACAAWLKTTVPEVPARWIAAGDPYWRAV